MVYALIASNIMTLAILWAWRSDRQNSAAREDRLLDRIQAPQTFVAKASPEPDGPGHISAFDDEALAELERDRARLS